MKYLMILTVIALSGCADPFIPLAGGKSPGTKTVPPEHGSLPEIHSAGSFSLHTPDEVLLLPWSDDTVFDIPRGTSFAIRFAAPPDAASLAANLHISPSIGGSWAATDDRTMVFIPSYSLAPSTSYTVSLPKSTISFYSIRRLTKLLEMEGSGRNSFTVSTPFPSGATVDLLTDPLDGAYQFRLTFSEPLEDEGLKEETSRRIAVTPLFPPDAPYPSRIGISWLIDRQLILQYRNMFPDPEGRDLIYRFALAPPSSTDTAPSDIEPEGMIIYLKVKP